jgi:hypothetical protein
VTRAQNEVRNYLKWYARQDLFAPIEKWVTRVMCGTFACNLFLLVLAVTAAFAMPEIQEHRLKTSLLARSIWIGQMNNSDKHFSPEKLSLLGETLTRYLPESPPQVSGFHEVVLPLALNKGDRLQRFYGRTISDDDPLLEDLEKRHPEINSQFSGIIASDSLKEILKFSSGNALELQLQLEENSPEPIVLSLPCRHVESLRLPNGHSFLIREAAFKELYSKGKAAKASNYVLQLPWDEFVDLEELLEDDPEFKDCLSDVRTMDAAGVLRLRSSEQQYVWEWKDRFKKLSQVLSRLKPAAFTPPDKWNPQPEDLTLAEWIPPQTGFHNAEVRVNSVDDLSLAAAACREAGYPADDVLVQQVKNVQESGRILRWAVGIISALVLVSSVIVVAALQHLRWRQKTPETGMLRILGIKTQELGAIQNHQSCTLWLYSVLMTVLAILMTVSVVPFLFETAEAEILLTVSFRVTLVVVAVALPLIRVALHFATRTARSISPLGALLGNES